MATRKEAASRDHHFILETKKEFIIDSATSAHEGKIIADTRRLQDRHELGLSLLGCDSKRTVETKARRQSTSSTWTSCASISVIGNAVRKDGLLPVIEDEKITIRQPNTESQMRAAPKTMSQ